MRVYVDALREYGWRLGPSCHLLADTVEELHAFAARLGMRRGWFQVSRSGVPHYDLTARRRAAAVRLGANQCSGLFLACLRSWKGRHAT